MTGDVFRRLALVAGCSGWATAIAVVWIYVHWAAGLAALLAGPVGAIVLTLEPAPAPAPDTGPDTRPDTLAGRLLGHREIAARARAAQGSDDDD